MIKNIMLKRDTRIIRIDNIERLKRRLFNRCEKKASCLFAFDIVFYWKISKLKFVRRIENSSDTVNVIIDIRHKWT